MKHYLTLSDVYILRPNVATVVTNMDLWNSNDPTTGAASDSRTLSHNTKTFVEGKTTGELLAELKIRIAEDAQAAIDSYQQADTWENSAALINTISDIDGTLES